MKLVGIAILTILSLFGAFLLSLWVLKLYIAHEPPQEPVYEPVTELRCTDRPDFESLRPCNNN